MKKRFHRLLLALILAAVGLPVASNAAPRTPRDPAGGVFFYAKHGFQTNAAPAANPDVLGGWVQFYWSELEPERGRYNWSVIDTRMKPWLDAGKKVAFRIYWVGSGYWADPAARTPTPGWVWQEGARFVKHAPSGTEVPLPWDPVYQLHALHFLGEIAHRYEANTNILFFDVTPGAETNPYRYVAFNQRTPEFKEQYAATPASDGRKYSDELWQATVREWIAACDRIFQKLPLVVTLNVGTLNLGGQNKDYSVEIGQYAVDHGFYVGQNGLAGGSYREDSARKTAFLKWSKQTRIVFETLGDAGTSTQYGGKPLGSLREIIEAAQRVNAHYLLPYPADVLKATQGQPNFDPAFAQALAYGAQTLGQPASTVTAAPQAAASPVAPPAKPAPGSTDAKDAPGHFKLEGEHWTYRDDGFEMNGILLKPEGKGPFPAILISHGLGGSAESFGLNKARDMVKWGFVCIAPNYTHSAQVLGIGQKKSGPPQTQPKGQGQGRPGIPANNNFGASEENIRRAQTCVTILRGLPEVDRSRIVGYGHSMGGFVTIGLAVADTNALKSAAITGSGVAPNAGFAAPSKAAAEKIRTPFLMMHGSVDTVVRPDQSVALKEVLDHNHVANERFVFEGEGHPIDQNKRDDVFTRLRAWFIQNGVLAKTVPQRP